MILAFVGLGIRTAVESRDMKHVRVGVRGYFAVFEMAGRRAATVIIVHRFSVCINPIRESVPGRDLRCVAWWVNGRQSMHDGRPDSHIRHTEPITFPGDRFVASRAPFCGGG